MLFSPRSLAILEEYERYLEEEEELSRSKENFKDIESVHQDDKPQPSQSHQSTSKVNETTSVDSEEKTSRVYSDQRLNYDKNMF